MKKKNFIEIFEFFERGWKAYQITCYLRELGKNISESTVRRRIREKYGEIVHEKNLIHEKIYTKISMKVIWKILINTRLEGSTRIFLILLKILR